MLYEAPPFYMINGVSILPDHADPLQFYYQPLGPHFVTRSDGTIDVPQLLLIKFRSASRTGGFLDFDVHLGLTGEEETAISRELRRLANLSAEPKLVPVPVVDGSVKLMLLGAESGVPATGAGTGTPGAGTPGAGIGTPGSGGTSDFVRSIHHAAKPSLYGDNRAAFSVELDERGITILDQAMRGEMAPIGVVYSLDYLALRPAYHVRLQIDWDRVQDVMDTTYGHEGLFTNVQIQDTVEKLIESRAIQFEADTFVPEDEGGTLTQRRDAAVARVRDMITDAFFESSLDPQRQAPDGWDKARDIIKSFSPQRSSPLGVFSYKKTHYTRVDKKRLDVDFSERITLKRSMYPQGHLTGLFRQLSQGLDPARLVVQVDADDPWFKRRKVRVISRADFQNDPVRSLTATLTYGGQTQTVLLDKDKPEAEVEWPSTVHDGHLDRAGLDAVHRRAEAGGWRRTAEPADLCAGGRARREPGTGATRPLLARNYPDPHFAGLPFRPFPAGRCAIALHGSCKQHPAGRLGAAHQGCSEQLLATLPCRPPAGPIMAKLVYRAADGRDHETPFASMERPQVDVPDPFPQRLKVSVVPALNFAQVDRAFVDLVYEDPRNDVHVEDSIELAKGQPPRPFVVDRVDPTLSRVRFKVTILMLDSDAVRGAVVHHAGQPYLRAPRPQGPSRGDAARTG